ncbi:TIGR03915 family putative DNA repair protein [Flagellimonas algicola]|uniref:DUF4130 domain-containing protein n=1 Tax=Flagellimonas algicola TaxID=2583815 RepID=A0ABY2WPQ3_9FLAO|nr:TIGR03915 family putative DNA repair protein [Allomuricauda algicola]TMU56652.1 DUF4130 domain-containing protein [Allomuricauda algicola]
MGSSKTIIYDSTFNGFLTLIFKAFEHKWPIINIQKQGAGASELFANTTYVKTDVALAKKVWSGVNQKNHTAVKRIYYAFLSEQSHIEILLYHYIQSIMGIVSPEVDINDIINTLNIQSNKVAREKGRMEAFVQFQLSQETGAAHIKPKYNVLPLLSKHLRQTYKGRDWQVFDDKRKYGIRFSTLGLELISNTTEVRAAV